MKKISKFKLPLIILAIHLLMVLYFSVILPADIQVPRQWNFQGEVGSFTGKGFGLWFMWGINAFLLLVFILFPYIDPRYKKHQARFDEIIPTLMVMMTIFMFLLHLYMLLWAAGVEVVREYNGILFIVGFLFILLGNILPKIPSNFYAGYRTPWTLSSDTVWKKTHRLGGYCFVISGLLFIIRGFFRDMNPIIAIIHLTLALGICLYPILYSYLLYAQERREKKR